MYQNMAAISTQQVITLRVGKQPVAAAGALVNAVVEVLLKKLVGAVSARAHRAHELPTPCPTAATLPDPLTKQAVTAKFLLCSNAA